MASTGSKKTLTLREFLECYAPDSDDSAPSSASVTPQNSPAHSSSTANQTPTAAKSPASRQSPTPEGQSPSARELTPYGFEEQHDASRSSSSVYGFGESADNSRASSPTGGPRPSSLSAQNAHPFRRLSTLLPPNLEPRTDVPSNSG